MVAKDESRRSLIKISWSLNRTDWDEVLAGHLRGDLDGVRKSGRAG